IGGIEAKVFSVPSDPPSAISLGDVCSRIERLLHRPIMWQINWLPGGVIKIRSGSSPGNARLGVGVGLVVSGNHRERNIALVEQPPAVQQEPLARGRLDRRRCMRGTILR